MKLVNVGTTLHTILQCAQSTWYFFCFNEIWQNMSLANCYFIFIHIQLNNILNARAKGSITHN